MPQVRPAQYLPNERVWLLRTAPDVAWEILVGGDSSAPDPAQVALVEAVLPTIEELVAKAKSHLDRFVDRARFAQGHDWYFEGLATDTASTQPDTRFRLEFSNDGDVYGYRMVTFTYSQRGAFPREITRLDQG